MNRHSIAFLSLLGFWMLALGLLYFGGQNKMQQDICKYISSIGCLASCVYWGIGGILNAFEFPDLTNYSKLKDKSKFELIEELKSSMKDMEDEQLDKALDIINAIKEL